MILRFSETKGRWLRKLDGAPIVGSQITEKRPSSTDRRSPEEWRLLRQALGGRDSNVPDYRMPEGGNDLGMVALGQGPWAARCNWRPKQAPSPTVPACTRFFERIKRPFWPPKLPNGNERSRKVIAAKGVIRICRSRTMGNRRAPSRTGTKSVFAGGR